MPGKKLTIKAYKTEKYSSEVGSCTVKINPSSYKSNYGIEYNKEGGTGMAGKTLDFKGIAPETVSFDIHFDSTGVINGSSEPITDQLDKFKKVCLLYNGAIHQPNFLIVSWSSLQFRCKLTSMSVNYTLFKSDGTPLRAVASVQFEEALDSEEIARLQGNQSPDLTHAVLIKAGDKLPLICKEIYGDASYYMEVASFNKLVNFRHLEPGTIIHIPPIK
ncbi:MULTISPECIES: CIS tube protein [Flavobacteriales]|uniref:CIS tube protein n=1 Tax=Flavobacteriales TaxID=200644 RepID=UPI003A8D116C